MKLSQHDKNLVAMSWLVEVFLNGLAQTEDNVSEEHKEKYSEIAVNYQTALNIIQDVNAEFSHDIDSVFGQEFKNELSDLIAIFSVLFQTTSIKNLNELFKWAGQNVILARRNQENAEQQTAKDEVS